MGSGLQAGVPNRLPDIIARHPALFRGRDPLVYSYVLEGWYELVDGLCADLEQLLGDRAADFEVVQVKEKFSSLRFYWRLGGRSQLVGDLIGLRTTTAPPAGPDEKGYVQTTENTLAGTRMDLTPADDLAQRVAARVKQAEQASTTICETCGARGRVRVTRSNYFFVACPAHTPRGAVLYATWRRRQDEQEAEHEAAAAKRKGKGDE